MKKNLFKLVISLIFVVMTVVCLSIVLITDSAALSKANAFEGGDGSEGNPYKIKSPEQWMYFSYYCANNDETGEYFELIRDITFNTGSSSSWGSSAPTNDMTNWQIGSWSDPFVGNFNGNGHVISGFYINVPSTGEDGAGIFCTVANHKAVSLSNLVITNSYFYDYWGSVGALVGQTRGGQTTINNIYVTDSVYVEAWWTVAGGVLGHCSKDSDASFSLTVSGCANFGAIKGASYVGGIVGNGNGLTGIDINNCLNGGLIIGTTQYIDTTNKVYGSTTKTYAAGILGRDTAKITVSNCVNLTSDDSNKPQGCYYNYQIASSSSSKTLITIKNCCAIDSTNWGQNHSNSGSVSVTLADLKSGTLPSNLTAANGGAWTTMDYGLFGDEICLPTGVASFAPATPWSSYQSTSSFTVSTNANFQAISTFVNAGRGDFSGKSILIGADLTFNSGTSSESMLSSAPGTKLNPIGTEDKLFRGTFNGQKHILSGLYMQQNVNPATGSKAGGYGNGIFGNIGVGATIQNLIIANSCFIDEEWLGAVVGEMHGGTIENIWVKDDVYVKATNGACVGGIAGGAVDTATNSRVIQNCVFAGILTATTDDGAGGIFGLGSGGKALTIDKCLVLGSVNSSAGTDNVCGFVGYDNYAVTITSSIFAGSGSLEYPIGDFGAASASVTGCYSIVDSDEDHYQYNANGNKNTGVTYGDTASDYICGSSAPTGWTARGTVTSIAGVNVTNVREVCVPSAMSTLFGAIGSVPVSSFKNIAPAWLMTGYTAGTIAINSVARYIEFAKFFDGDYTANTCADGAAGKTVRLDANLTFNDGDASGWSASAPSYNLEPYMIGSWSDPFRGTFNGNGKTIAGFYAKRTSGDSAGIIEVASNGDGTTATIQNLIVTNSYFYAVEGGVAAILGQTHGGTTNISNCYVTDSVYIEAGADGNGWSGASGIVGHCGQGSGDGYSTTAVINVTQCLNAGHITAAGGAVGGIVGNGNGRTVNVTSCMNTGTITGTYYVAGMVGCCNEGGGTITTCLNVGNIVATDATYGNRYAEIWSGNCSEGRSITVTNCRGLSSRLVLSDGAATIGNLTNTGNTAVEYMSLYGSSAATTISGFTKRANDIMVPTGVNGYVGKVFDIRMEKGASVRTRTPFGIRFVAEVNLSAYTNVTEWGILYGPTSKVSASGFNPSLLTNTGNNKDYVKVPSQVFVNAAGDGRNGYYKFALAVNVAEKNYHEFFSARAYVIANGVTYYSDYMELNNSRSVADVARLALEDVESSSGGDYTTQVGTVYSCYSTDQRTELKKYFNNEVRVLHFEMGQNNETYDAGRTNVVVKEIYKYDPDIVAITGAADLTFSNLSGYTISGLGGSDTAKVRVLYRTDRFNLVSEGDFDVDQNSSAADLRYVELTDKVTGKTSIYAAVDKSLTNALSDNIKNSAIGNGSGKGLIMTGYFGTNGDNSQVTRSYLTSIHKTAPTQYYTTYYTRHSKNGKANRAILTGSVYKSGSADSVRYRISEEQFGMCSAYNPSVCDYILK